MQLSVGVEVAVQIFMVVIVNGFIAFVDVGVGVDVLMLVGVNQIAVAMFMAVDMSMLVGVLQGNGILDHQNRGGDHDGKTQIELSCGPLAQHQHAKNNAQEGSDGIVGAGFGGSQILLGADVEIDTQSVGYKAQKK